MKKTLFLISIAVAGVMATTDFSQLTTEELINLRGQVAPEDREAFRAEMQSRVATMTAEERATLQASRQIKGNMRGQGANRATPPTFESIDTDGDGKITQAELDTARANRMQTNSNAGRLLQNAGNAPSLSTIDTNRDGVIDANEFQAHQTTQMATQQGMGMRSGSGQRMGGGRGGHGRP